MTILLDWTPRSANTQTIPVSATDQQEVGSDEVCDELDWELTDDENVGQDDQSSK